MVRRYPEYIIQRIVKKLSTKGLVFDVKLPFRRHTFDLIQITRQFSSSVLYICREIVDVPV